MLPLPSLLRWARKLPSQEVRKFYLYAYGLSVFYTFYFNLPSLLLRFLNFTFLLQILPSSVFKASCTVCLYSRLFLSSLHLSIFSAMSCYKIGFSQNHLLVPFKMADLMASAGRFNLRVASWCAHSSAALVPHWEIKA